MWERKKEFDFSLQTEILIGVEFGGSSTHSYINVPRVRMFSNGLDTGDIIDFWSLMCEAETRVRSCQGYVD